jgi:hypothetical protein
MASSTRWWRQFFLPLSMILAFPAFADVTITGPITFGEGAYVKGARVSALVPNNAALTAAPTNIPTLVRGGFASLGDSPPLTFNLSNSACSLNAGAGDGGSQVPSSDGKCWLAAFPGEVVDVTEFGADPTGVADVVAPVNAAFALGSNHIFVFPPGIYRIKSSEPSPYPLVVGPVALKLLGSNNTRLSNIKIIGTGATITTDASHNNIARLFIDYIDQLEVDGLTFLMDATGLPDGSEPTGASLLHLRDALFSNIYFTGNWGGNSRQPFGFSGDWLEKVQFNHIAGSVMGGCFDFAFVHQLTITDISMVGADNSGAYGNSRSPCVSIAYDAPFVSNYPAVASFTTSLGVTIANNNIQGFSRAIELRAGQSYDIIGNILFANGGTSNPITGSGKGSGLFIESDGTSSDNDPVINVSATGNIFSENGATVHGAGILLDTTAATANFGKFNFTGNIFDNNWDTGVGVASTNYIASSLTVGLNTLIGANQTTGYGAGVYTYSGTVTLPGIVTAANCSGQPSGSIIATTGTGVLVQCP